MRRKDAGSRQRDRSGRIRDHTSTGTVATVYQVQLCLRMLRERNGSSHDRIVKAPTPAPVIKRSLASASTVAHVMYQKYVNGMPLYRQEKDWANHGLTLSRATLANWIIRSANDWLMPLWEKMKSHLLIQAVVHADETVIQVLKEEGKKPSSESRMWVHCSGNTVLHRWCCLNISPPGWVSMRGGFWKVFTVGCKPMATPDIIRC